MSEKTTKQVTIEAELYKRAEEAVPAISEAVGFKVQTNQAIAWLVTRGLRDLKVEKLIHSDPVEQRLGAAGIAVDD